MLRATVTARGVPGFQSGPVEMELPTGSTVATVLDLVMAAKPGGRETSNPKAFRNVIVTLNGRYVPVSQVETQALANGDALSVMPLIVGG